MATALMTSVVGIAGWALATHPLWSDSPTRTETTGIDSFLVEVLLPTPTELTAADGDRSARLTFDPPPSAVDIDGYEVQVNDEDWAELDSSGAVDELTNGESYRFRVRAVVGGSVGQAGPWSNEVIPYGPPRLPRRLAAAVDGDRITWSWSEPSGNGREVDGYLVSLDGADHVMRSGRTFSAPITVGPLQRHELAVTVLGSGDDPDRRHSSPSSIQARVPGTAEVTFSHRIRGTGDGIQLGPMAQRQTLTLTFDANQSGPSVDWVDGSDYGRCIWDSREYIGQDFYVGVILIDDQLKISVEDQLWYNDDVPNIVQDFCFEQFTDPEQVDSNQTERSYDIGDRSIELPDVLLEGNGATGRSTERRVEITVTG